MGDRYDGATLKFPKNTKVGNAKEDTLRKSQDAFIPPPLSLSL